MEHLSLITKRGGGRADEKYLKRYYFGEHLGLHGGSRPLGESALWPLAARCLAVLFFFDFLVFGIQPRIRPICVRTILAFEPVCDDLLDSKFVRSYKEPTERAEIST